MRKSGVTGKMVFEHWSALVLAVVCIGVLACSQVGAASGEKAAIATGFIDSVVNGKFTDAVSHFDAIMRQAMSADQLKQTWQTVIGQCGAFKNKGEPRLIRAAGFDAIIIPCRFEATMLDVKIVFDPDNKIGGLWFLPPSGASDEQPAPPVDAHTALYNERKVTVGSGEWKLPGTLTLPNGDGPFPAVVLVHGSGPNDRDETIGPNKPFRDLAWGLASQGIAVLRYDKRTKVYGAKVANLKKLTVKEEVIDDALAAVKLLRNSKKIDGNRIFVLGHSLGGMLIPRIGKADQKLAGLIIMAGPTRPLEDIILEQIIYIASINGAPSADAQKQIAQIRRQVANVKSPKLSISTRASSLFGVPAAYWLDLRGYHPAEEAKSLKQPMIILQGGRDYQATTAEYDGWKQALSNNANVTFKLYPSLNHLFAEGEGKSTPKEYETPNTVSKAVIDDLVTWINAH